LCNLLYRTAVGIDRIIHFSHGLRRDGVREALECRTEKRLSLRAGDVDRLIRREVSAVVLELTQNERVEQPAGGRAGDYIQLTCGESTISQSEVHLAGLLLERKSICLYEAGVAVRPRHKVLPKTGLPITRNRNSFRDRAEGVGAGDFAAHKDREIIRKAERRAH